MVLLTLAAMLPACASTFVHMQESYVPHDNSRPAQVLLRVTGEACEWKLFGLFAVSGDNSANTAMADLTNSSPKIDNILAVHVIETSTWYLLVSKACTEVSGYPVVYKDTLPKLALFDVRMLRAGEKVRASDLAKGGVQMSASVMPTPEVAPTATVTPTPTTSTAVKKGTEVKKTVAVTKTVTPPPAESAPTQAQCEAKCGKFAGLWKGSDAIKTTIRGQCVKKCLVPGNKAYRECIEDASKIDDITRCNSL